MSIAYDATGVGGSGFGFSFSWSHTATAGADVFAYFVIQYGLYTYTGSATYGGVPMIELGSVNLDGGAGTLFLFYLPDVAGGEETVEISPSWGGYWAGNSVSYTGVDLVGTPATTTYGSGESLSQTVDVTFPGQVVIQGFGNIGSGTLSSPTGGTNRCVTSYSDPSTGVAISDADTTTTFGATLSATDNWGGITAALVSVPATPTTPVVTAVSPTETDEGAGINTVEITGYNFTGATAVNFGTTPAWEFTVNSDTSITAYTPTNWIKFMIANLPPGGVPADLTVDVIVITPAGSSANTADQFTFEVPPTPAITSVVNYTNPTYEGTSTGAPGDSMQINGTHLGGATALHLGDLLLSEADWSVNSDEVAGFVVPSDQTGTVDVTITTPVGTSETGPGDELTYAS
jgi:hypothetical protein